MAEALRLHGSIYPLHTLYNIHEGQLPPLRTFSEVKVAIQSLLCRNAIIRQTTNLPNLESNDPFSIDEFNCLFQALIGGTIQPDLYHGRALSVHLIASLQAYVDTQTNYRLQFAEQPAQAQRRTLDQPIKLFYNAMQNDTILHLATGAFSDPMVGFDSLMTDCPEPAVVARALMRNDPTSRDMSHADSNKLVLAVTKIIHRSRRDLKASDSDNTRLTPRHNHPGQCP
jgi:hypothetical protein